MDEEKRWVKPEETQLPDDFRAAIGGHPLVAQTLYRRGYHNIDEALAFMDPDRYQPASASELPDSHSAYSLLAEALEQGRHILVWGDFDVDGQTATTLLVEALRSLGGHVSYHIPIRETESHGITRSVLETYLEQGFDLLLTCDTGISEHENIAIVREAGIPVVVTDHHALGQTLPPANAVVNPQRLPSEHPLRTLPGVGVAYKLMEGLYLHIGQEFDADYFMALAALGIVADVAELQGDTRYILQRGLRSLRDTQRIGLQTLYKNAELIPAHLTEDHIGFQIAPRLNAIGRLGDANPMVEFLSTKDAGRARILGTQIEAMNAKRRFATRQVEKAAEALLQASPEDRYAPAIVLHHPDWPGGVVGIVANRLVEQYLRPTILLTGENPVHGSGRSVEGINITEAIATQADLLIAFGGHPMAAGLSLPDQNLNAFKRGFLSSVAARAKKVAALPEITLNRTIHLDEITFEFIAEVERLAPFGLGNPPLYFLIESLSLVSSTTVGQSGEHRQLIVSDEDENKQRFIWWNGGDENPPQAQFDLVCKLSKSDYKGSPQISAEWVDFRLTEKGRKEISSRQYEVMDHRTSSNPVQLLQEILHESPDACVWGEGQLPDSVPGVQRDKIVNVETLIIWTSPPSQSVLQEAIHQSKPEIIHIFGQDPNIDKFKFFIKRLGGLAKYAVKYKNGKANLSQLAAACAAEVTTVRVGLHYWEARGNLQVDFEQDEASINIGENNVDRAAIDIYHKILIELLSESRAYRHYFKIGEIQNILSTVFGTEI